MGAEAMCTVTCRGARSAGKAKLETDVLQFRGASLALSIPFKAITKVTGRDGRLTVTFDGVKAVFELGDVSHRWADKIANPPSRLDKIGVKPAWRVSTIGIDDAVFLRELEARVDTVVVGRAAKHSDAIFFGATDIAQLSRLDTLKRALTPAGALWIVRPRGRPEISESAVMKAGKDAGLVDVKVVRFSDTHTAEKFVIPVAARPKR
jgi:hypothetical protein